MLSRLKLGQMEKSESQGVKIGISTGVPVETVNTNANTKIGFDAREHPDKHYLKDKFTKALMISTISHALHLESYLQTLLKKITTHLIEAKEKSSVAFIKSLLLTRLMVPEIGAIDPFTEHLLKNVTDLDVGVDMLKSSTSRCQNLHDKFNAIADAIRFNTTEEEQIKAIINILI